VHSMYHHQVNKIRKKLSTCDKQIQNLQSKPKDNDPV